MSAAPHSGAAKRDAKITPPPHPLRSRVHIRLMTPDKRRRVRLAVRQSPGVRAMQTWNLNGVEVYSGPMGSIETVRSRL